MNKIISEDALRRALTRLSAQQSQDWLCPPTHAWCLMSSSPLAKNTARAKPDLAKADQACGGKKDYKNDAERVAFLFELHQKLTAPAVDTTHAIK